MDADLDLLLIAVYCMADDFLPARPGNARRRISDAEVITLCVAQAMMGVPCDERFLRAARRQLGHLFPHLPERTAFHKRRLRLSGVIEALIREFARHSPGFYDGLLLVDSTPVECARSRETVKRAGASSLADALANAADYGYCASHSRFFWGFRLHALFAPDGTPRALILASPKRDEREVALELLARARRAGGETVIGDKGYASRDFARAVSELDATIIRPRRKDEPGHGPHLAPIRQRIESIFWTCKDILTLERHGARTLAGLRERILQRFLCLAAAVALNHQLDRPSRALVNYCA